MNLKSLPSLLLAFFCFPVMAETVFLEATRDNTLYESPSGRLSNGAGEHLFAGLTDEQLKRRAVIAFQDLSAIREGATITSVRLHLNLSKENSGPTVINVSRLTASWGEGASVASENEGRGANSEANDATWSHRFWDIIHWFSEGGDFNEAVSAQLTVDAPGRYTFESSETLVSDVQGWLDETHGNFGWILIGDETARSAKRFDSRENAVPANRPVLEVTFSTTGTSSDFSGLWYDATLDGEGYNVYQTPAGWLIYFFGYSADGEFLWLTSDLVRLKHLEFGVPFELPMLIGKPGSFEQPTPGSELVPYGTLKVTFTDCTNGLFELDGLDGPKTSAATKLVGIDGGSCQPPSDDESQTSY
jgi:hypothetical protein